MLQSNIYYTYLLDTLTPRCVIRRTPPRALPYHFAVSLDVPLAFALASPMIAVGTVCRWRLCALETVGRWTWRAVGG